MKDYKEGYKLGEDEFLLKIRPDRNGGVATGFLTKFNKDGSMPKAFKDWGGWSRYCKSEEPPLPIYIYKEDYRSGWAIHDWRFGQSQNWAEMIHPGGFTVEIYLSHLLDLIKENGVQNGQLIGMFRWEDKKLIKL